MSDRIPGQFVWYDLLTTDSAAAQTFYTELFGWKAAAHGDGGYVGWQNGEHGFGGIEKAQGGQAAWVGYVEVPDVDAAVAKTGKMGGETLMPPMNIPGSESGRIACCADPQGAVFSMYQQLGDGHEGWNVSKDQPGDFGWAELSTEDVQAAMGFYGEIAGLTAGDTMEGGDSPYYTMNSGETPVAGMMARPPMAPPVNVWNHYVNVEDVAGTAEQATKLGGTVLFGPMTIPGAVTFAMVADPQGACFGIAKSES